MMKSLGYLSAAPRVSTLPDAEATGPRTHVLGVINAFESLGWNVKPFIVGDQLPRRFVSQGSENLTNNNIFRAFTADLIRLSMSQINSRRALWHLRGEVDWVYERFGTLQSMGHLFKKMGIPWILETNAIYFQEASIERSSLTLTRIAKQLEINAYHECDILICISPELKTQIIQETGTPSEKILIVRNGVDTDLFSPKIHEPIRFFEGLTIGFVGHLYAWQGLDKLFNAVSNLKEKGIDINIVVIGDGQMQSEWETLSANLSLTKNVKFVGRVAWEDIPRYIAGFDIGYSNKVLSTDQTPYFSPLKLYEYMAMEKPVLCSMGSETLEVVQNKTTGFLFSSDTENELRDVLYDIYQLQDDLPKMGKEARQEVVAHHSWQARVKDMIARIQSQLEEIKYS